jgi:hypothetical protein
MRGARNLATLYPPRLRTFISPYDVAVIMSPVHNRTDAHGHDPTIRLLSSYIHPILFFFSSMCFTFILAIDFDVMYLSA